jgi:NAD(P)-dependent dehydrogenase (short-subunit alcohol dehydrogenase family)
MGLWNAVVTGASRGLGLELCQQLSQKPGYQKIYAVCRHPSEALIALTESSNQKVSVVDNINVMEEDAGSALQVAFRTKEADPIPIHLLVHNAGAYGPPEDFPSVAEMYKSQDLENVSPERMMYALQLNAFAPLFVTQALLPNLRAGVGGEDNAPKVIIISSVMGSIAESSSGGHYGYRAAKAAVNMIGKNLSVDLKEDKIAVGLVHPGFIFTGFDGGAERREGQRDADEGVRGILEAVDQVDMSTTGCFLHGNYGEGVRPLQW